VGFLRLALASSVLVSHTWPVGLGRQDPGHFQTRGQASVGALAVDGFFVLSGFLITASGLRFSVGRFAWHRFLRIFPGLWVCLLVTALVIAPGVAMYERGTLAGFWNAENGPLQYLLADWWSGMQQYSISGLLSSTPTGQSTAGGGAFDGSLWSLVYELTCYVLVGCLVFAGALKRAPRMVVVLAVLAYLVIVDDYLSVPGLASGPRPHAGTGELPLIGSLDGQQLIYLGFLFLLGMVAQLYKHRIPVHPVLVGVAALALVGSLMFGGFLVVGLPAYAYLLLWAAAALPKWLHGVGRKRDYSYGIYIYAFPVQQVLVLVGGARYGVLGFIVLAAIGTVVLSVASWHLVERPAMSLKDVRLTRPRKRVPAPTDASEPGAGETIDPRDDDAARLPGRTSHAAAP
jgi:peptidoglycan/LPS O-acetylase OafA/YrhL